MQDCPRTTASVLQEQSLADDIELGAAALLTSAEKYPVIALRRSHAQADCCPAGLLVHLR